MFEPLNPSLYNLLRRRFGKPRVSNAGESMIARPIVDLDGRKKLEFTQTGEYYNICCPFCNDTRYRLSINHQLGAQDRHERVANYLAYCFNENCLENEVHRDSFMEMLQPVYGLGGPRIKKGKVVTEEDRAVLPPGPLRTVDELPTSHKAVQYLRGRGFDVGLLGRKYQVSYCRQSRYYLAADRIIVPIFERNELRGWQARYIGELAWKDPEKKRGLPPKYFSCPGSKFRSQRIYNWERMKLWQTAVIVEGPSDVWRFGAMAGCVFGNSMTPLQRRKFLGIFRERTGVLLLDPEEYESKSTKRLVREMRIKMPGRFCAIKLPEGTDPGSLDRDFMRESVRYEAAQHGVKVVYRKVA